MPEIALLDESLNHTEYRLPYLQAMDEGREGRTNYSRVPESFWLSGLCATLSGAGIAMYLIAQSRAGWGDTHSFWISPKQFAAQYDLGDSTRKKGLRELVGYGVLGEETKLIDITGGSGYRRYRRNVYTLAHDHRSQTVGTPAG
ncbi:MAG TPA: hypothetical protein VFU07_00750 [Candidatus Lumbricidophila sp.]|nr:hypothetical protein [Candidatus Lumbricidophila sp.]